MTGLHPDDMASDMTARQYFAAHAPPMPEWFREMFTEPDSPHPMYMWPWCYADLVIELADKGPPKEQPRDADRNQT